MANWKLTSVAAAAIGAVVISTPSGAAPVPGSAIAKVQSDAARFTTDVQYRGFRGPRHAYRPAPRYYRRGGNPWPFIGFGSAIVAGAILADRYYAPRRGYYYDTYDYDGPYYYPSDYRGDPREVCARHFRSFEWDTGLYTTYRGEKRVCPYLGL